MAQQIRRQWWGLLPGVHRLSFDQGQVLLTLAVGSDACAAATALAPKNSVAPASHVLILGAGLAGAAAARALADAGCRVTVHEAGPAAASGASGLPAGLLAPHVSGDDNVLSQICRAGIRSTIHELHRLLPAAANGLASSSWQLCGIVEHWLGSRAVRKQPEIASHPAFQDYTIGGHQQWMHLRAGWYKPADLIRQWLLHPLITVHYQSPVSSINRADRWMIFNPDNQLIDQADHLVLALGSQTNALLGPLGFHLPLQAIRGQVSFGQVPDPCLPDWPRQAYNGNGSLIPNLQLGEGLGWVVGSGFDRLNDHAFVSIEDHLANEARWASLHPQSLQALRSSSSVSSQWQGWSGVRITYSDRLPLVGQLDALRLPGLHLLCGFGARGLTLASLCGQLLASELMGLPLPISARLAGKLKTSRLMKFHSLGQNPKNTSI